MILSIHSRADYQLPNPMFVLLQIEPALEGETHQVQDEHLQTTPTPQTELWNDLYGNPQRRLMAPGGQFSFDFVARVETQPNAPVPLEAPELSPDQIPAECMIYTLPSRYCQSDRLAKMAMSEFGFMTPGGGRISTIAGWINQKVTYQYGTSNAMTDAFDTATSREGVCRDFAHLLISFCRALGVPARYVSGYCLGLEPPDFHAWVQVYLGDGDGGGAWHNVDATWNGVREALVPIAFGRDAADVAMMTFFGEGKLGSQSVSVQKESD